MYPKTVIGKIIAGIILCFGICVIAIPIGVIGANFSVIFAQAERKHRLYKKFHVKKE